MSEQPYVVHVEALRERLKDMRTMAPILTERIFAGGRASDLLLRLVTKDEDVLDWHAWDGDSVDPECLACINAAVGWSLWPCCEITAVVRAWPPLDDAGSADV